MSVVCASVLPFCMLVLSLLFFRGGYYDSFVRGAKVGLDTTLSLLPPLILLIIATGMLSASGAAGALSEFLAPFADMIGFDANLLPLVITRPFSGAGSLAMLSEIFDEYGADSHTGICASIIMGSSDTLVYIIALYFSSAKIKKTRHAIPAAVITMLFTVFLASVLTRFFFPSS